MDLTPREEAIINLLCYDKTIIEIAKTLRLSTSTIEKQIRYLKDFYNVNTLTGLVYKYLKSCYQN